MLTFLPDTSGRDSTRAAQPRQRARRHRRRRQDGQEDGVRRQAGDAAGDEGARARRARRRAAEPVADEGHRRRSQGRHQGRWSSTPTATRTAASSTTPTACSGRWTTSCTRPSTSGICAGSNGKLEPLPALSRGQWQVSQDDAGRIYRNVNDSPLFVDYTPSRYFLRNPNERPDARPLRAADRAGRRDGVSRAQQPRRQPRLPRSVLPRRRHLDRHSGRRHADDLSRRRLSRRSCRATRSSPTRRPTSCIAWC